MPPVPEKPPQQQQPSAKLSITLQNTTSYTLVEYAFWGSQEYIPAPPIKLPPNANESFKLHDTSRSGLVYLAIDQEGNEVGFVSMSFEAPSVFTLLHGSAEGSAEKDHRFISAGLQQYSKRGTPMILEYKIGKKNEACWGSGRKDNGEMVCAETRLMRWCKAMVNVKNDTGYELKLARAWNENWTRKVEEISKHSERILLLDSFDAGSLLYRAEEEGREVAHVSMSVVWSMIGEHGAEGSKQEEDILLDAGLQKYQRGTQQAAFRFITGRKNEACWYSGEKDDGVVVCEQTELRDMARVLVYNDLEWELAFGSEWYEGLWQEDWIIDVSGGIAPKGHKLLLMRLPGRGGVHYYGRHRPYHISFSHDPIRGNHAEGSELCGLQPYEERGSLRFVKFVFRIGTENRASWNDCQRDDGELQCPYTDITDGLLTKERIMEAMLNMRLSYTAYTEEGKIPGDFDVYDTEHDFKLLRTFQDAETGGYGYLALDRDRKIAVVAFRGTDNMKNVEMDLRLEQVPWEVPGIPKEELEEHGGILVADGFYNSYVALRDQMLTAIDGLHKEIPLPCFEKLYFTGHSLGGAITILAGFEMAIAIKNGNYGEMNPSILHVVAIAPPPVANSVLRQYILQNEGMFQCSIFKQRLDMVPNGRLDLHAFTPIDLPSLGYYHPGRVFVLDNNAMFPDCHYLDSHLEFLEKLHKDTGGE